LGFFPVSRSSCTLFLWCLVALIAGSALAAPAKVDSITTTGDPLANPNRDDSDLISVTVGSNTYTGLTGATVSGAPSDTASSRLYWPTDGTEPGDGNAAMGDLGVGDAQANGGTDNDTTFQFGRVISSTDVMFFFDLNGDDSPTLTLVDAAGDVIGGATLTIAEATDWSSDLLTNTLASNHDPDANHAVNGTSFTLSDFAGSATDATGFMITTHDGVDPILAAIWGRVSASDATGITGSGATANGELLETNGATYVWVAYGASDGTTNKPGAGGTDWDSMIAYDSGNPQATGTLAHALSGLSDGTTYHYRFYASNATWEAWSGTVSFDTLTEGPVSAHADAHVRNGPSSGGNNFGNDTIMQIKRQAGNNGNNRKVYVRFDLASLGFDHTTDLSDASLALNFVDTGLGVGGTAIDWTFGVWGLNDGDAGEIWGERTITWNNAPQNDLDTNDEHLLLSGATKLGTFNFVGRTSSVSFSDAALTGFIAASTIDDLVTLVITRDTDQPDAGNNYVHGIGSKEHATVTGPELALTGGVVPKGTVIIIR